MTVRPEKPWVVTLFAPPILRVTRQEYQRLLAEPAQRQQLPPLYGLGIMRRRRTPLVTRLRACQRQWAQVGGWRPYERWRRLTWTDEDEIEIIWPKEPKPPYASQPLEEGRRNDACLEEGRTT